MFRCESIVDHERPRVGGARHTGHHRTMSVDGTHDVAAAVKVQQHALGVRSWWNDPLRLHTTSRSGLAVYVARNTLSYFFHPGT
jgi:hypothetical protein